MLQYFCHRANPVPIGMRAKAVIEAGALQAIAMRYFNSIDLCHVERARNILDMLQPILMADSVHPIAQCYVLDIELLCCRIEGHAATPSCIRLAMRSAILSAAEVMMSRFPA